MAISCPHRRAGSCQQGQQAIMLALLLAWTLLSPVITLVSGAQWSTDATPATPATRQDSRLSLAPQDAPPGPSIPNLIDVLSASENHTVLLRLFQRARLIPTLIMLQEMGDSRGLTIFAPTDDAIVNRASEERQIRQTSLLANSREDASYVEWDIAPRSTWEWALHLASDDAQPTSNPDSNEDLYVPVWYGATTRLDNINAVLRQQLLYHMVNYTLPYNFSAEGTLQAAASKEPADLPDTGKAAMLTTLHLPSRRLLHEPTRPGPIPQPPSRPPHPGAEDSGGLLGGEGQKVRIARADKSGHRISLGTNSRGEGGVHVIACDSSSPKGIILSIDGILDLPPSFDAVLKTHPDLQYLLNLTSTAAMHSLSQSAHATFLLPKSDAFDALSNIERTYLMTTWPLALQDRLKLFGQHMSGIGLGQGTVAYADRLRRESLYNLTTIFGGQLLMNATTEDSITAGKANIIEEDILTENGVIHIVDRLLLQNGDLGLSVEKTLLALNASKWVSLIHKEGLGSYIDKNPHGNDEPNETIDPWTFLVPRDDAIKTWLSDRNENKMADYLVGKWGFDEAASRLSNVDEEVASDGKMQDVLLYHIAPDMLQPQNLTDGMLIGTELRGWKLRDARQRVPVGVDDTANSNGDRQGNGDVGFGNANVIAAPVEVGPSIIYLISQILEPPTNPIQTAVSSLSLSTFVATVFSAELDKPVKRAPAVTYVVPHNDAFSALGLAMPYLLLDQKGPREELRSMVEYHAIDQIVYLEDFANASRRYPTLEGSPIWAGRDENGTVDVRRGRNGRNARVIKGDILTSTGVLHEIDQVELPPTLDLTIEKLMKGAKAETMRDLVQQAGYGWILNGTTPSEEQIEMLITGKFPDGKKHKRDRKRHKHRHKLLKNRDQSFTVLCPTDSAFTRINLTYYYEDRDALRELVQMHIIPSPSDQLPISEGGSSNQLPIGIRDEARFATLLDASVGGTSKFGKIAFRKLAPLGNAPPTYGGYATSAAPRDEEPGLGWMVGVADTRGTDGRKVSARVLNFGRESLALEQDTDEGDTVMPAISRKRRNNRPSPGSPPLPQSIGGVLTIDAVLHPYTPGWFYRWGWIVTLCFALALVLAGGGYAIWLYWRRDGRIRLPEALEGEEE